LFSEKVLLGSKPGGAHSSFPFLKLVP
jgi:hypothetical protein